MLNPILASSALRRMRSARTLIIVAAYELVLLAAALFIMSSFAGSQPIYITSMKEGLLVYMLLMILQFLLIVLVSPAMTASSIAGERDRQTLELLLVTNTGSWRIVMGKLLESFAFMALLVLCSLPVMCLPMLTGGVTLPQVLGGAAFLLVCAFAAASVGVMCSSFMKNTVSATIVSYIVLLVIGVGTLIPIVGISNKMAEPLYDTNRYTVMTSLEAARMLPALLYVNPGIGLFCLLEEQTTMLQTSVADGWGRLYATFLMLKKIGYGLMAQINTGIMLALSFLFSGVAALLVRPRRVRIRRKQ